MILIQQRSRGKKDRPLFYDASVGAQVSSGETYEKAAHRELFEELGIRGLKFEKICKYKSFSKRQREIRTLFVAFSDGPFKSDEKEIEKIEFKTIEEITTELKKEKLQYTDGFKISFSKYLEFIDEKN
ncbi:NUDIX domain-containing protein [Candidatus Dojkabacteria bacterium]|nr:NUDIX domain-containing protein [Candidatus Dojkabacteria bacterium]